MLAIPLHFKVRDCKVEHIPTLKGCKVGMRLQVSLLRNLKTILFNQKVPDAIFKF